MQAALSAAMPLVVFSVLATSTSRSSPARCSTASASSCRAAARSGTDDAAQRGYRGSDGLLDVSCGALRYPADAASVAG
jgi:hypothetical protein